MVTATRPRFTTHDVANQPPELAGRNLFATDPILRECVAREGGAEALDSLTELGDRAGSEENFERAERANRNIPVLRAFDRYGNRIDEVRFDPAYHELMALAIEAGTHSVAHDGSLARGGHVAHAARSYLLGQVELGTQCPVSMTYSAIPVLRKAGGLPAEYAHHALAKRYDPRLGPAAHKAGLTFGMAMTEKQGGSDVRANTTHAMPLATGGAGEAYALVGHKWFCSAPMSDAFLTLAQTDAGLGCFFVPRVLPDGTRNAIRLQRLKDKLGNRSNASSEIEYHDAWALLLGDEGRGVATIIEMVHHTRFDATTAGVSLMRMAFAQALHHCEHRSAFGKVLIDQPLMRNVLADLALELEASVALVFRIARAFDEGERDPAQRAFARLAVAAAKYWVNRRVAEYVDECMNCLGGAGYVEESILPRLFREAPLNGIWEGAYNVIALDVLRTLTREPLAVDVFFAELDLARGSDGHLDTAIDRLRDEVRTGVSESSARSITQRLTQTLQGTLLTRFAPSTVASAFCRSRLGNDAGTAYGALPATATVAEIFERMRA